MKTDKKKTGRKPARGAKSPRGKKAPAGKKRPVTRRSVAPKRKGPRKPAARAPAVKVENEKAHLLAKKIAQLVLDKKATDVAILDVRGIASYADYIVLASGDSERQVAAMAENVATRLKQDDHLGPIGSEGQETGQWVLMDYGDVVAHLFYGEVRAHYDLEGLFADAAKETVS